MPLVNDLLNVEEEFNHYYVDVSHLEYIDVYRVLTLFNVTDPAVAHAVKKLLCSGRRGHKDQDRDIMEATKTLIRSLKMREEDANT